ncbi:MAG: hypothetical protein AAGB11_01625 [Pseudomonadota bacterium]
MSGLANLYSHVDAAVMVFVAAVLALASLLRKRRPITKSRAMDVALSSILFVFLGVRYAVLTVLAVFYPSAIFSGASSAVVSLLTGLFAAAALAGFLTYRGGVGARVVGALVLSLVCIAETLANALVLHASLATRFDTVLSIAVAAGAGLLSAFFWTYRTAAPNPLGADKRPFDY